MLWNGYNGISIGTIEGPWTQHLVHNFDLEGHGSIRAKQHAKQKQMNLVKRVVATRFKDLEKSATFWLEALRLPTMAN